ncbi:glycoside hydrolase family 3 N-terminal domain-containing protein [Anaeromassilibacillus senegalensis]|uniref:glycoside hydrolase family 3 N-terminal domain-containing protein n=1 Tax=Anaeromassilibacillus senegalensis TaxID=1673717 RepID=UPI000682A032|nr:glycoside hydrolase family 3 N-terminal domain-containing protein [Anaeromassilibacillus senegalensis]
MNKNRILSFLIAAALLGTTVAAPIGEAQAAQQEEKKVVSMGTDFTNTEVPNSTYEYYKDVLYVENEGGATLSHSSASNVDILYEEASGYYFKDLNQNGKLDDYEDWRLSSLDRAKSLAAQLKTEQRLALMTHGSTGKTKEGMKDGTRFNLTRSTSAADKMAEDNNKLQFWAEDTPEMFGIPVVTSTDPRHTGIVDSGTIETTEPGGTVSKWPNNMGIAATFDADSASEYGAVTAAEYRAIGIQMMLGPQMDLITEPRWSRNSSTFSEDPELNADMASAFIEAMQTDTSYEESDWGVDTGWGTGSVATIAKHWPSGGTGEFGFDAHKDDGKFGVYPAGNFETILQYFVKGAGFAEEYKGTTKQSAGVMPYYTIPFEQDPSGENVANGFSKYIVQQRLREDLNYDGLVCTDWKIHGSHEGMGMADTPWGLEPGKGYDRPYRVLASMLAGVDQMGGLDSDTYVAEDMMKAYEMGAYGSEEYGIEALGEDFMDELTEASATRILKVMFNLGLFEDPYADPDYAKSFVGSPELNQKAYETHKDAVIMAKNSNSTLPLKAEDGKELTAYVPLKKSTGGGWGGPVTTTVKAVLDLDKVQKYYNVPDALIAAEDSGEMPADEVKKQAADEADFAIIELQSPGMAMEYTDGRPQNLTYGPYTADAMRETSIGYDWYHADGTLVQHNETPDESKGDYKSNRSRKGNTHAGTPENLELIQETVKLMGDKPIIFILSMENPMVVSEFEPDVDALLIGTSVSPDAFLEVISGQSEPNGLLPVNMPASMEAIETAYEDGFHDMEVYKDSDGNAYCFGFGLNWDGQIADERTAKYTDIGDPKLEKTTFPETYGEKYMVVESQEVRDEKVDALINSMTVEEKFALLGGGANGTVADAGTLTGVPRLGVPQMRMFDGPAGVTSIYDTTNPPIEQMLGSTWSTDLSYDYGKISGSENRAISGSVQLGSQFDITRTAHFGRSKDQLGEDPFLISRLAVSETEGIQDQNVMATLKHFAVFAQDSTPGGAVDVQVDEQTLHELYLAPFEAAVKEADACRFVGRIQNEENGRENP